MGFPRDKIDLAAVRFTPELLGAVPKHLVHKYHVLPVSESRERLSVAIAIPIDLDTVDSLSHLLHRELEFRAADEEQLATFIRRLYGSAGESDR